MSELNLPPPKNRKRETYLVAALARDDNEKR
jgi:hypothetical protein